MMKAQTQNIVNEIEEIKARLIAVEILFLESEEASGEDKEAVKEALQGYKQRKTVTFEA